MSKKRRQSFHNGGDRQADDATPKRRRQYTEEDSKLAELYENLASEIKDIRMKASKELVLKFSPENSPETDAVEKALYRLAKGLCSNRKAARFGFFITLTELLRQIYDTKSKGIENWRRDVDSIIDLVTEQTQPEKKAPSQERRDHLLGKLLGYNAIIQSSILLQDGVPLECWTRLLDLVYGLARDNYMLREECGMMLCDAVKSLGVKPKHDRYIREMLERLSIFNLAKTPEGVAIWLTVMAVFPELVLPNDVWAKNDPLAQDERKTLASVLKESFPKKERQTEEKPTSKSAARPSPNYAWEVVMAAAIARESKTEAKKELHSAKSKFAKLWINLIDENLFLVDASLERKSWGFQLFAKMIASAPKWAVPALFTPNLLRSLNNHQKDPKSFLQGFAKASLNAMQERVKEEPGVAALVVVPLTAKPVAVKFDQSHMTKSVEGMIRAADSAAKKTIAEHMSSLILRPRHQEQPLVDSERQQIAHLLLNVIKSYKGVQNADADSSGDNEWLYYILTIFVQHAYFIPSKSARTTDVPLPTISETSRTMFRDAVSSCLTHLLSTEQGAHVSYPYIVLSTIQTRSQEESWRLVFDAEEAVLQTIERAQMTLNALSSKRDHAEIDTTVQAFLQLYSLTLLQVYNGDADAILLLDELEVCRASILEKNKSATEQGFDMLLEILLSFLAKPSLLYRKLAGQIFSAFSANVTSAGLASMTEILEKKENLSGHQELFEQEVDDAEGTSSEEDSGDASDVEMINPGSDESVGSELESDQDSSDMDNDNADNQKEDEEELARFDTMLAQTLKTSNQSADMVDSSDDEDMDDEQMMALDPHLTKIFQQRSLASNKNKKKEMKDAKTTIINFKLRVLDLLSIYVKKENQNPLALQLILPLLQRLRSNGTKEVVEKSFKILKEYFTTSAKGKAVPKLDDDESLWATLREIHEEAKLGGWKMHYSACSKASLFVAKTLVALDRRNYEKAEDVYSITQKAWFLDTNSKVHPSLFTEWINWSITAKERS